MVYRFAKYDLEIMVTGIGHNNPKVLVTLGSEARTFQLERFINFWLDLFKVGCKAADARAVLTRFADSTVRRRTPRARGLKRRGLKIMYTGLNRPEPDVVIALGSEVRTLQLEEFNDLWQEMKELLPKAAVVHLAYKEQLARQSIRQSREVRRAGRPVLQLSNAQGPPPGGNSSSEEEDKSAVWFISPDVLATYTEDGALLLNVPKEVCYSLNSTASRIWLAMESSPSGITLEVIVGELETNFNVPRQALETGTAECLDELEGMGLVQCGRLQ